MSTRSCRTGVRPGGGTSARQRAVISGLVLAAGLCLGWLAMGSIRQVVATSGDEKAQNATPSVEYDACISWETNNKPEKNDPAMPDKDMRNLELDKDPHPKALQSGDGNEYALRVFPDLRYYSEDKTKYKDLRKRVFAVVQWVEGHPRPADNKVRFRLWDVDDPSAGEAEDPLDTEGLPDKYTNGPDNQDRAAGCFAQEKDTTKHIVEVELGKILRFDGTKDDSGNALIGKVEVQVSMRPGDNYRFAASVEEAKLLEPKHTQVMADAAQAPPDGKISKILTVWRKLHVELDSMDNGVDRTAAGQVTGVTGVGPQIHNGEKGAMVNVAIADGNRFEGGKLAVAGGGTYDIQSIYDWGNGSMVVVKDPLSTLMNDVNKNATATDDDNCPLRRKADLTVAIEKFAAAFVLVEEEANVSDVNVQFVATLKANPADAMPLANGKKNLVSSAPYWTCWILSCYQCKKDFDMPGDASLMDADPDFYYHVHPGSNMQGDNQVAFGFSALQQGVAWEKKNLVYVFLEACRDRAAWGAAATQEGWPNPQLPAVTAAVVEKVTVAHELCHIFGWVQEGPANTLMAPFSSDNDAQNVFDKDQLLKIRTSTEIEDD
jgi:hypothetical protein